MQDDHYDHSEDIFTSNVRSSGDGIPPLNGITFHSGHQVSMSNMMAINPNLNSTHGRSGVPRNGTRSASKRKRTTQRKPLKRLSGKPLIDTYSKRSQTLIEKGRELEELTGARTSRRGLNFYRTYLRGNR
ncbi:hypothetical protein PILCRDRAFT_470063 [Piloderma croceum F 1598]|uniref:Uncharacterized protein n=1 Tax=Piloderma croceum (strain F 1598) TaxID=765440 RepID=A0A0C3FTJ2_PILCF|nr:hypothetical protein PILCRDRAFT_470063 [Piloderma croceum F 1598]